LCRLIVVGVNSFQSRNGYTYQRKRTPPAHVVFQFQNIPVKRRMNPMDTNEGGYGNSEMRKYLTQVDDDPATGNFFKGLVAVGVPDGVVWTPARAVSDGNNTLKIIDSDKLWLPSGLNIYDCREYQGGWGPLYVDTKYSPETTENQAWFEYGFAATSTRIKWTESASSYWLSSRENEWGGFYISPSDGDNHYDSGASSSSKLGVAPTFCVYGGLQP
jgi:hypothetical protein